MTRFLLIRHGHCPPVGRSLAGRSPGVSLDEAGIEQVRSLADRLAQAEVKALYASPLERTRETAGLLADKWGIGVETWDRLGELDCGEWTGRTFASLEEEPAWLRFNQVRSLTRPPRGELAVEVQCRMVTALETLAERHPDSTVAVVSHADPIKALLGYLLGIPQDLLSRLEVEPASVSAIEWYPWGPKVRCINSVTGLPW